MDMTHILEQLTGERRVAELSEMVTGLEQALDHRAQSTDETGDGQCESGSSENSTSSSLSAPGLW
jgi:hypothetical protein